MFQRITNFGVPAISMALLIFGILHITRSEKIQPPVKPLVSPPRSPYASTISGAGIVEPQSENIAIGSNLPGVVVEVFVSPDDCGKLVKQGERLFRVDDRHLVAQLAAQEAQLLGPTATLARLRALPRQEEIAPVEHRVKAASANLARAADNFARLNRLASSAAITEQELVDSREARDIAQAEWAQAQSELELLRAGAWAPDLAIAEAEVARIKAQIAQTRIEIERSTVLAPVDGQLLQVNVRPGEFVGTPPVKNLLLIGDMRHPRIRVDIDESDIPRFKPGSEAKARIRGNLDQSVRLRFVRVEPYVVPKRSLTGANNERVDTRVLQVLYEVVDTNAPIFVGQQVDVFIDCDNLTKAE